jgi:hypothetical protein
LPPDAPVWLMKTLADVSTPLARRFECARSSHGQPIPSCGIRASIRRRRSGT